MLNDSSKSVLMKAPNSVPAPCIMLSSDKLDDVIDFFGCEKTRMLMYWTVDSVPDPTHIR